MIGYNFGLGFMPGPFRFGASSGWFWYGSKRLCVACGLGCVCVAVSFLSTALSSVG
ncbi:hypothetical protein BVIET440_120067 [Burkholderia vietnamiensis]|nr:hypothetical protein BVI1335_1140048 [Burkholderia vietnamiensis]CAG9210476.1 hypothetical protein BVI2075_50022 [Burkholderia vietnamiensis]